MRDILFRGKRIDNGEMIEGNYIHRTSYYGLQDDTHFIVENGEFDYDYYTEYKVLSGTVGQYTGLTDKKGKRIFEGDIMEFDAYGLHYKGVVSFVDGNFGVMCNSPNASPFLDVAIKQHDAICVGNIYENTELLEGD